MREDGYTQFTEVKPGAPVLLPRSDLNARPFLCGVPRIDPRSSRFKPFWDALKWNTSLLICFIIPLEIAFADELHLSSTMFLFDRFFDVCTLCDMVVQCVTAMPDPGTGVWLTDPRAIALSYATGRLWFDIVSLLPSIPLLVLGHDSGDASLIFWLRCARMLRMLRLRNFADIILYWQTNSGLHSAVMMSFRCICITLILVHWMACFWTTIGKQSVAWGMEQNWIDALRQARGPEVADDPAGLYWVAVYWSAMTFTGIGYGDITPQNKMEYRACSIAMLLSGGLWAYTIAEACSILTSLLEDDVHLMQRMDDLNGIMEERMVPAEKRRDLRKYLLESWRIQRLEAHKAVVQLMSPMLRHEIVGSVLDPFREKVKYIGNLRQELLADLASEVHSRMYAPKETVPPSLALNALSRGMALRAGKLLFRGDVWGEDMLLHNELLRNSTPVRSLTFLEVLSLEISAVRKVVSPFPVDRGNLRWGQAMLALRRGIRKIGETKKELQHYNVNFADLSEEVVREIVSQLFTGTFDAHRFADPSSPRMREAASAFVKYRTGLSNLSGSDAFAGTGASSDRLLQQIAEDLAAVKGRVETLSDEMGAIKRKLA